MDSIHQYKNNGYDIILDINSGSVHVVDDLVYDIVEAMDQGMDRDAILDKLSSAYGREQVEEGYAECEELIRDDQLFSKDVYADAIGSYTKKETVVKALCLHVAHTCNLACRYCFAEEGEYHGQRAVMSVEVGRQALDFLVEASGSRRNLEVDFFGGEPLMDWNVVREVVAYGRSLEKKTKKRFRFTMTTNGVLLDEDKMAFIDREMSNVVLSLDGRPEVHDRMRPFPSGAGSYEQILPKFLSFAKRRGDRDHYVRGTFTRNNLDFSKDVLHLADLGFKHISMEPVVAPENADYALRPEDVPAICEQYDILAREMIRREREGRGFRFFHFMIDLSGGPCVYKRLSGCGSGTEYLAVTPWGDLYPCHQFVGIEDFRMGTVYDGVQEQKIRELFSTYNVYTKPACRECFARFYCSGGCAANAYSFHRDMGQVYELGCALERKRVECALMIKAALA